MKKKASVWKYLLPLIIGILVMSAAFILISYVTFRDVEIEDYEAYAQGLTDLIAKEIIDVDSIGEYLEQGRGYPGYEKIEHKLGFGARDGGSLFSRLQEIYSRPAGGKEGTLH